MYPDILLLLVIFGPPRSLGLRFGVPCRVMVCAWVSGYRRLSAVGTGRPQAPRRRRRGRRRRPRASSGPTLCSPSSSTASWRVPLRPLSSPSLPPFPPSPSLSFPPPFLPPLPPHRGHTSRTCGRSRSTSKTSSATPSPAGARAPASLRRGVTHSFGPISSPPSVCLIRIETDSL